MSDRPPIRLSVCIPTANRARFVAKAVESVIAEGRDDVDIVVSDNASRDDTEQVVRGLASRHPRITYFRQPENRGFDPNYLKVIELARGEWVWVLGDDDWLEPRAIERVLAALDLHPDAPGVTVACNTYDVAGNLVEAPPTTGRVERISGGGEMLEVRQLGYLIGNISTQIFNRAAAVRIMETRALLHNGCSCHHLICHLIADRGLWLYLDDAVVAWRSGNDSAMANGLSRRAHLALTAYRDTVADVFGRDSATFHRFMDRQQTIVALNYVVRAKNVAQYLQHVQPYRCGLRERLTIYADALRTLYRYPRFWTKVAPVVVVPGPLIPALGRLTRPLRRRLHSR